MFNNQRYLTHGIAATIPPVIQHFLWQCIDAILEPRDYLQVFQLSPCGPMQRISHTSEEPPFHREYLIPCAAPLTEKIYVIDSEEYSTMLLASEY